MIISAKGCCTFLHFRVAAAQTSQTFLCISMNQKCLFGSSCRFQNIISLFVLLVLDTGKGAQTRIQFRMSDEILVQSAQLLCFREDFVNSVYCSAQDFHCQCIKVLHVVIPWEKVCLGPETVAAFHLTVGAQFVRKLHRMTRIDDRILQLIIVAVFHAQVKTNVFCSCFLSLFFPALKETQSPEIRLLFAVNKVMGGYFQTQPRKFLGLDGPFHGFIHQIKCHFTPPTLLRSSAAAPHTVPAEYCCQRGKFSFADPSVPNTQ